MKQSLIDVLRKCEKRENPLPLPSHEDWSKLEAALAVKFPAEFIDFYNSTLTCYFGTGDFPSIFGKGSTCRDWIEIVKDARAFESVPDSILPFYDTGNGDYHCFKIEGETLTSILYWYHDVDPNQQNKEPHWIAGNFEEWVLGYADDRY